MKYAMRALSLTIQTTAVATDATAVFGPRSTVFSPIPPDFEELLGKQECKLIHILCLKAKAYYCTNMLFL